jgi:elongation factor G
VADHDEQLADAWLEGRVIDAEQLRAAIRRATLAGAGVPVLAGAAFKDKGIETLLDAVVDYLPSPLDRPAVTAESDEGEVVLPPDPDGPLAGLLFKITHQQHGALSFVRLYSGTLKVGDAVASSQHPQGGVSAAWCGCRPTRPTTSNRPWPVTSLRCWAGRMRSVVKR